MRLKKTTIFGLGIMTVIVLSTVTLNAQVRTGVRAGVNTMSIPAGSLTIMDEGNVPAYDLSIDREKIGVHIGFFVQAVFGPVFLQPELLFNSQSIQYRFKDLTIAGADDQLRDESYQSLDFPLVGGLKFGPVRATGGMIGHLFLNSNSDIRTDFGDDFEERFETLTWGWQAGLGLDLWQLHIDLRYERSLDNFGNHLNFYGRDYQFDAKASRIVASLGISF